MTTRSNHDREGDTDKPYGWWGYDWQAAAPLSIVRLIAAGSLDTRSAATLWLLLAARASIVVAARPSGAGKTTMLGALSDFLPPDIERIYLRGWSERFDFLARAAPARSYLLCNEISPHLPVYLWGQQVRRLFAAVSAGYGCGATMHAESLPEVINILAGYPLGVPQPVIARLDLLLTLAADHVAGGWHRHLASLILVRREGVGETIDPVLLARWDADQAAITHPPDPPPVGLLRRTGLTAQAFMEERDRRAAFLNDLVTSEVWDPGPARAALAAYSSERTGER